MNVVRFLSTYAVKEVKKVKFQVCANASETK